MEREWESRKSKQLGVRWNPPVDEPLLHEGSDADGKNYAAGDNFSPSPRLPQAHSERIPPRRAFLSGGGSNLVEVSAGNLGLAQALRFTSTEVDGTKAAPLISRS